VWFALAACGRPEPPALVTPEGRPPNVLIVLLDDVGTDKIGAYAEHPRPAHTPNLDALAAEGVLFRNAWATPQCSPSRAALLTGRYGRRSGVGRTVQAYESSYELPPDELTLPEMLRGAPDAWDSSEVGKWHLATYASVDNVAARARRASTGTTRWSRTSTRGPRGTSPRPTTRGSASTTA
jgi:arylsulfatase A-like enzyme